MARKQHGLAVIMALCLVAASWIPAMAQDELVLSDASLSSRTVTVTVSNLTASTVTGRVVGVYDTGKGIQEREATVKLAPNQSTTVQLTFTGKIPLGVIVDQPDPIGDYIVLGTITDDINPQ